MAEATGLGTKFNRETDVPGTFAAVGMIANITPPGAQRDVVEVDDLNPVNEVKKKLVGLIDSGELSLTLNYDPEDAGHGDLEDDFHAGLAHNYQIELASGGIWGITGIVTGFAPSEISAGDVMQAEVTITVTAKPEYTPAD